MVLEWIGALSRKDGLTIILTTHHPHHALAVADDAFLMMGETQYVDGPASQVLTEENLTKLYGSAMKRVTFEHEGRSVETLHARSSRCSPAPRESKAPPPSWRRREFSRHAAFRTNALRKRRSTEDDGAASPRRPFRPV